MKKPRDFHLHDGKTGSAIAVRVIPRSSRNEIAEILSDGTVKIRLKSSTSEEEINRVLFDYLAEILSVSPTQLEVVVGSDAKDKLVTVENMDTKSVHEAILRHLA